MSERKRSNVVPMRPDAFRAMDFSVTADEARSMRADWEIATDILLWAQETRQIALQGKMTPKRRIEMLEASAALYDHPRLS